MGTQTRSTPTIPAAHLPPELPPSALHAPCDPAGLGFKTTDELPDLQDVIGQPRALRALELGSEVGGTDYNIFVLGLPSCWPCFLSLPGYLCARTAPSPARSTSAARPRRLAG